MRVQLRALPLLCLGSSAALAGDRVSTRADRYADGWVTAWVPQVRAEHAGAGWTVGGGYALDVVSGATFTLGPDVVSSATWFDASASSRSSRHRRWTSAAGRRSGATTPRGSGDG